MKNLDGAQGINFHQFVGFPLKFVTEIRFWTRMRGCSMIGVGMTSLMSDKGRLIFFL